MANKPIYLLLIIYLDFIIYPRLMKKTLFTGMLFVISALLVAQQNEGGQKKAMERLSWLEGTWQGVAWTQMGAQSRDTFLMTEIVNYDLDRTIIEVEGIGKDQNGDIAHHAKAVISYSSRTQKYQWHAWRIPGGIFSEHEPQVSDGGFTWAMETPQGKIRYSVSQTADDGWFETGEFSGDGQNWMKFFEMTLTRVNTQETSK